MQKYMYEKAMAQETRNGGTSTLNNNNGVDNSKKKLLIALDIFCLLLGECIHKFALNIPLCYNLIFLNILISRQLIGLHAKRKVGYCAHCVHTKKLNNKQTNKQTN